MGEVVRPGATASLDGLRAEYEFLVAAGIDPIAIASACDEGARSGTLPHMLLLHRGALTPARYLELLESTMPPGWRVPGRGTEIVDALAVGPSEVVAVTAGVRARGNVPLFLSRHQFDWSEAPHSRRLRVERAANGLARQHPELSARTRFAVWQLLALPTVVGLAIGGLVVVPEATLAVMAGVVAVPFVLIVGLRLLSLFVVLRLPKQQAAPRIPDAELPAYSVLVPLFREADVLPDLVAALHRLDYPPEKLDILLILESVDEETQAAVKATILPQHMRAIVVPDMEPRTKPKALNYALRLSRGDYIAVYDAEDDPDPDQLRRAVAQFRRGPANLMCLQGRLAIDNRQPGWLACQFMLEYAALFDGMLPALARLQLPIPLGGTSNHFPRAVIEKLGGWDAWNVTEDADLGIRLARAGGRVQVLDSTTYEEAPEDLAIWLRQRTRWLKGFMQTWLVHMRRPGRLFSELGPAGFIGFNAFLGGIILSALIHPIFLGLLAWEWWNGNLMALPDTMVGGTVMTLALFNLVCGYASGMAIAGLAATRRGMLGLLPHLLLMPLYWLLISVAAYRAALQLITHPHLWEKTPHTSRAKRGGRREGV